MESNEYIKQVASVFVQSMNEISGKNQQTNIVKGIVESITMSDDGSSISSVQVKIEGESYKAKPIVPVNLSVHNTVLVLIFRKGLRECFILGKTSPTLPSQGETIDSINMGLIDFLFKNADANFVIDDDGNISLRDGSQQVVDDSGLLLFPGFMIVKNGEQLEIVFTDDEEYLDQKGLYTIRNVLVKMLSKKVDTEDGKTLSSNDYTDTEKDKLSKIATGAEVNQNAISSIKVGSSVIQADQKEDCFEIAPGNNISITVSPTSKKITIASKNDNTTYEISTADGKVSLIGNDGSSYDFPAASQTLGLVKTTSDISSADNLTPCPIIEGVPMYHDSGAEYFDHPAYTTPTAASGITIVKGGYSVHGKLCHVNMTIQKSSTYPTNINSAVQVCSEFPAPAIVTTFMGIHAKSATSVCLAYGTLNTAGELSIAVPDGSTAGYGTQINFMYLISDTVGGE